MFHRLGNFIITILVILFAGILLLLLAGGAIALLFAIIKFALPIIAIAIGIAFVLAIICILIFINF